MVVADMSAEESRTDGVAEESHRTDGSRNERMEPTCSRNESMGSLTSSTRVSRIGSLAVADALSGRRVGRAGNVSLGAGEARGQAWRLAKRAPSAARARRD